MLIFRYLFKETFKSMLAIFLILMAIFMALKFVRVLGDATDGSVPANLVIGFLTLYSPVLASLILPISLFLGIMLAQGRLYVDSEMTVLKACGVSEWYITRVTLLLALAVAVLTAIVTLYLAPLAVEKEYELRDKATSEAGISSIVPGRFQQTGDKKAVIFIHDVTPESGGLEKVFLSQHSADDEKVHLLYAQTGNLTTLGNGKQALTLYRGNQYEGTAYKQSYQTVQFDEYRVIIGDNNKEQSRKKVAALPTFELVKLDSIEAVAELQWRIAIPLSLPFLVLIAVPLSAVDPRQGRFGKIFPALLLYLGYFLLLLASKRVLEDGKIPPALGLWWVHFSMLIIGGILLVRDRRLGTAARRLLRRPSHV